MPNSSKTRYWRSVFRRVMTRYDEIKSVLGTHSCAAFYNRLANGSGGSNPNMVRVFPADFVADVELTARRALTDNEFFYFRKTFIQKDLSFDKELQETLSDKRYAEFKHTIQEKVGKFLEQREIYPVEKYMRPKEISR